MGKSPRAHPQGSEVGEGRRGQEVLKGRLGDWDPKAADLEEVADPRRGCGVGVPYGEGDLRGELEETQDCRRRRKDAECR